MKFLNYNSLLKNSILTRSCKSEHLRFHVKSRLESALLLCTLGIIYGLVGPAFSENIDSIRITSNRLIVNNQVKIAEFIGKVCAIQGNTDIKADRVKIYYGNDSKSGKEKIDKIEAIGNVNIRFDEKTAYTERAVYEIEKSTITLNGPESSITVNNSSLSGSKITIYRKENRITVDGKGENRVNALYYPEGKRID